MFRERKKLRGIRPIKLGIFARQAYAGEADDAEVIRVDHDDIPLHAQKPKSRNEQAGLTQVKKNNKSLGKRNYNKL